MTKPMQRPTDPYSADWKMYWDANPELARGVGAEAAPAEAAPAAAAPPPPAPEAAAAAPPAPAAPAAAPVDKDLSTDDLKLAGDILNRDWTSDLPDDLKETGK